jgi:hypothetical protein
VKQNFAEIYIPIKNFLSSIDNRLPCLSRKPHPSLKYLQLERSSAILLHRLAHLYSDGLLHIYGSCLSSFFAYPGPDRTPNITRGGGFRSASATGRPQPENSLAPTASTGSILLGDSFATLEELAGGLDHRQTGDRNQMAQAGLQALLAMEVEGPGRPSEDRQRDS